MPLDFRLRIGMMSPASAKDMLDGLREMYREPKVFKFLHLPVQSASDRVLAEMQRGYVLADFLKLVSELRRSVPEITLSTDLIVGYPGETVEDHRMNMGLIEQVQPDIVNVTRFSPRPGTAAAEAGSPVVGRVAKDRSRELASLRFTIAAEKNKRWIGKKVRALATEKGKKGSTILRTDEYKQVVVPEEIILNRFYEVKIVESSPTHLKGIRADIA
jgi:tRNA A37 methylthiotransferase MiaB